MLYACITPALAFCANVSPPSIASPRETNTVTSLNGVEEFDKVWTALKGEMGKIIKITTLLNTGVTCSEYSCLRYHRCSGISCHCCTAIYCLAQSDVVTSLDDTEEFDDVLTGLKVEMGKINKHAI